MNKFKICIIPQAVTNVNGGVYNHCLDLLNLFDDSEHIQATMLPREISVKKLPVIGKEIFDTKALKEYITASDADIFHIHGFAVISAIQAMAICIKQKRKFCYSPHFHPFKYLRRPLWGKLFFISVIRPFLNKVSGIITINNTDTSFFKKFHKKVFKIPHYLKSLPQDNIPIIRKSDRILFVGRNESNKGIEYLEGIPQNYELVCVIDLPIKRDNTIYYSNISREELSHLYRSSSLVVVPSRYEAFSYVALEALSCGTPVLMSENVEISSYLKNLNGAFIFKYNDMSDFINSISIAIGKDVDIEKIISLFTASKIREQYENAYSKILES